MLILKSIFCMLILKSFDVLHANPEIIWCLKYVFLVVVWKERRNCFLEKCRVTSYLVDQSKPWNVGVMNWQRLELTDLHPKSKHSHVTMCSFIRWNSIKYSYMNFKVIRGIFLITFIGFFLSNLSFVADVKRCG